MSGPRWTLSRVAALAGGRLDGGSARGTGAAKGPVSPEEASFEWDQISLDTRTLRRGDFFVALRGENHDGHDHLQAAASRGAVGALVDHAVDLPGLPQIVVEDSLSGWQRWGAEHRRARTDLPLLALTGSSGKTTTKDLVAHLLRGAGPVWATEGNRNNHVGVPWMLLGISAEHRFAVIEMGMNHPGEIRVLSRLAAPTAAAVTDVGTAHVGYLGSREAILAAKLEILEGLPAGAPLVLPQDPWVLERLPDAARAFPIRTFGLDAAADWHPAGPVEWSLTGTRFATRLTGTVELPLLGRGALLSALAALAAVEALRQDVAALAPRLGTAPRRPMRMEPMRLEGVDWLLDCYNASPESTRLAIDFLRSVQHAGRRILVLGELGELGDRSVAIHQDLGRRAAAVETVLFVGEEARSALRANREAALPSGTAAWVADTDEAAEWLRPRLRPGDLVLLKGSRRIALERVLDRLHPGARARGAH